MTHVNIYVCVCVCARGGRRKQDGPNVHWHARLSLTRQLAVETAQCNAERLDGTEWVVVVHCKHVLGDTAELHHDVVNCTQTHTYTHCKHVLGDTAELHHDVVNCTQTHTYTHSA